jgi:hypothetical protein
MVLPPIHNKCRDFNSNLFKFELKPWHLIWIRGSNVNLFQINVMHRRILWMIVIEIFETFYSLLKQMTAANLCAKLYWQKGVTKYQVHLFSSWFLHSFMHGRQAIQVYTWGKKCIVSCDTVYTSSVYLHGYPLHISLVSSFPQVPSKSNTRRENNWKYIHSGTMASQLHWLTQWILSVPVYL